MRGEYDQTRTSANHRSSLEEYIASKTTSHYSSSLWSGCMVKIGEDGTPSCQRQNKERARGVLAVAHGTNGGSGHQVLNAGWERYPPLCPPARPSQMTAPGPLRDPHVGPWPSQGKSVCEVRNSFRISSKELL